MSNLSLSLAHEPFAIFSIPWPVEEGSDKSGVGEDLASRKGQTTTPSGIMFELLEIHLEDLFSDYVSLNICI